MCLIDFETFPKIILTNRKKKKEKKEKRKKKTKRKEKFSEINTFIEIGWILEWVKSCAILVCVIANITWAKQFKPWRDRCNW